MKKLNIVILTFLFLSTYCLSQNTIKLINGESVSASSIEYSKNSDICKLNGSEDIAKDQILCIIPDGKAAFTFHHKKNRKYKIAKRDIENNYNDKDLAKVYAYKYYKSEKSINELFNLNPNNSLSEEEFTELFNKQHKKIKGRTTTTITLCIVAFVVGLGSLLSSLEDKDTLDGYSHINNFDFINKNSKHINLEIEKIATSSYTHNLKVSHFSISA